MLVEVKGLQSVEAAISATGASGHDARMVSC